MRPPSKRPTSKPIWRIALPLLFGLAIATTPRPIAVEWTTMGLDTGLVRGVPAGRTVTFKGIPYASPPLGHLRWRAPSPPEPWRGIRDASQFGPSCVQPDMPDVSEDCLTINVWRPSAPAPGLRPVMMWIHGGGLVRGGSAFYPGEALAAKGVIVVSFNYRLGRLGFFAHPGLASEAPGEPRGNYGFLDQLAALHWVRRNIASFGGDPDAVTIFGESAGAGAILVHLTSPLSRGLFARAIAQSPALPSGRAQIGPVTEPVTAEQDAVDFARSLGAPSDSADAVAALRALPANKLVEGLGAGEVLAALSVGRPIPGMPMAIRDGTLIVDVPETIMKAGRQSPVPLIIGTNDRDLPLGEAKDKNALFAAFGAASAAARAVYDPGGEQELGELKQQVFADRTMVEPARHTADLAASTDQPTWLYRFSYVSTAQRAAERGAQHGFEIPYVLGLPEMIVGNSVTAEDTAMAELVGGYWVAFAATGDPNGGDRPSWPRHQPGGEAPLLIFTNTGAIASPDPLKPRLDLWQQVLDAP